jgi:hypothetical protein
MPTPLDDLSDPCCSVEHAVLLRIRRWIVTGRYDAPMGTGDIGLDLFGLPVS